MGMLVPVATTALPVALRLAGRAIGVAATRGGAGTTGLLGGTIGRGTLMATLVGLIGGATLDDLASQLMDMFGSDDEAGKTMAIIGAIEEAMETGAILIPEPPRGYEGTVYMQRLNYFHANLNDGKMWLSDFSNGKNTWRR